MITSRVLLIGGTGMVGKQLVRLIDKSNEYKLYVSGRTQEKIDRVTIHKGRFFLT